MTEPNNVVPIHPGDRGWRCADCKRYGTAECGLQGMASYEAACADFQKGRVRDDNVFEHLDTLSLRMPGGKP